jgi:type IX secretion system PorP/SprF family membrane protein
MRSLFFILLFIPCMLFAQDIHFSQWMHNPLFLSPALSGDFDGDYRINAQQRGQWGSVSVPFSTTSLGGDMSLKKIGFGAQLLLDNAGTSNLRNTQFNLSLATELMGWRGGLQIGFAQRSIDYSQLVFPDGNETFPSESVSFLDVGVGITRQFNAAYDKIMKTGFSVFHLNKPNRSFVEDDDLLMPRHQFFTQMNWAISEHWNLHPSVMFMQQNTHRSFFIGSKAQYDISDVYQKNIQLEFGTFYRWGDAVNILLGVQLENTHLAFGYDWNVSDLIPASNALGAWEFSLTYIIHQSIPKRPGYKVCPIYL